MKIRIEVDVPQRMIDLSTHELHGEVHDDLVDALIAAGVSPDAEIKIETIER